MDIDLFKAANSILFRKCLEEAVATKREGSVKWDVAPDQDGKWVRDHYVGWFNTKGDTTSLQFNTNCHDVVAALADSLSSPVLSVLFQEKSFWEASLYVGRNLKMRFSTSPTQWGEEEAKSYFCDPAVLAETWGVPVENFDRYLIDWGLTTAWVEHLKIMSPAYEKRGEKAYSTDTHEYGDVYQAYDFIKALGAEDPHKGERFVVHLPPIQLRGKR